ncbi:MAG: HAMP domain-containing histidine kinase [Proteobacteria bacterium]|nr:HAMP domain-containing histidine kinase [Pseudomonadota bacterium]
MRLTAKLTVTLMSVIIIVISIQAAWSLSRVTALHLEETRDDLLILASAVTAAVDAIWTHSGPEQARMYVERENTRRAVVSIRMVEGSMPGSVRSGAEMDALPADERARAVERTDNALVISVGLDGAIGVLELSKSLEIHQSYVRDVIWQQVAFTATLLVACSAALLGLGFWFIGRPVKLLVDQARTVAAGNFSTRAEVQQRDEIGMLAREMNRMSEGLEAAWSQLKNERRARTAALEQLRHSDRLSTVGKIASGIAHDLGTPLNVVSGRAMMIATTDDCPQEIAANAEIIAQQTDHMTRIIAQLLDFSRRHTMRVHSTNVCKLIEQAKVLVEPLAEEQGGSVELAGSGQLYAELDEGKVLQVLTNLMVNAIQAMPDGGILRLGCGAVAIGDPPDSHAAPGEYACITIEDQGVGIEADKLEHIFEPFFTTKEEGEGTGLGLSVCHSIVKEHGGWIAVDSIPGEGSTFSVYLPRGQQSAEGSGDPGGNAGRVH